MTTQLSQLLSSQQKYDELYDTTEKLRDDVDVLMKSEKWEAAALIWMQIDTNMLEISLHQSSLVVALVDFNTVGRC